MKTARFSFSKKLFTFVFVVGFCFSSINAPKAQAVGAIVNDPIQTVLNGTTSFFSGTAAGAGVAGATAGIGNFTWSAVGKNLLDHVAYAAAQNLLNQLTQNTIKWIQGGFHGSPSFAVDTNQMFTEIADNIAGGLVLSLRNIAICNFTVNYKDDLANAVYLSTKKRPYTYNQKATCPWKEDINFKASDFYSGVSRFTWDAFGSALEDGGNPYSVAVITAEELASREEAAKADKEKKLSWSNGFADIIDPDSCNYPPDIFYYAGDTNPDVAPEFYHDPTTGPSGLTQEEASAKNAELLSDPARIKALQSAYCKTTTPGKIVGDQLTKTLGLDMDRLGFADNMNKIVAAFLNTITQKTIRGVFGSGDSSYSTGTIGGGGFLNSIVSTGVKEVIVTTTPAGAAVTKTTAVIKGSLSYAGSETQAQVRFYLSDKIFNRGDEYDDKTMYAVTPSPNIATTNQPQDFWATITSLKPNTTYYYNANVSGSFASSNDDNRHGEVLSFTTQ